MSTKALSYLDKAMATITTLGINTTQDNLPVQSLIQQVSDFGPDQAVAIAMVLSRQGVFNEAVRQEITGMDVANRYELINEGFASIRETSRKQLGYMETGKLGFFQKLGIKLDEMRKGTIPQRFAKIKKTYIDVSKALSGQLSRETSILDAYADYRFSQKDAESMAHQMLENAKKVFETSQADLATAQKELDDKIAAGVSDQERTKLELIRDEKIRAHQSVDERYQIAKDLADQLRVAYHASEFVFARLKQTSQVKKRLYDQGVTFFATNEIVFTGQAAAFNASQGLHEGTQTLNAMKDGMNKGLEELANMGGKVLEEGLRAGYGPGLRAESLKMLIDSTVEHEESSINLIGELRKLATDNSTEVAKISEEGKQRFAKLLTQTASA